MFSSVRVALLSILLFFIGTIVLSCSEADAGESPLGGVVDQKSEYIAPGFPCYNSIELGSIMKNPLDETILLMGDTNMNATKHGKGILYVTINPKRNKYTVLLEFPTDEVNNVTCIIEFGILDPRMHGELEPTEKKPRI